MDNETEEHQDAQNLPPRLLAVSHRVTEKKFPFVYYTGEAKKSLAVSADLSSFPNRKKEKRANLV